MGKKAETGLPAQPNNSLINGIECLYAVINAGKPIGSVELAKSLGKGRTTINRLLGTLQFMGLLVQDSQRKYIPGPAVHVLAAQSLHASDLQSITLRVVNQIPEKIISDCVVALGILYKKKVLYLFHKKPTDQVFEAMHPTDLYNYEDSIIGKLLYNYELNYQDRKNEGEISDENHRPTLGYLYLDSYDQYHERKICFPIGHIPAKDNKQTKGIARLSEILRPIAGLAFADRSCRYSAEEMLEIFSPYAVEICKQLNGK